MKTLLAFVVICATLFGAPGSIADSDAGQPAARSGDFQVCPAVTNLVPHVGGPLQGSANTVLICGVPAAVVGDLGICNGPPTTLIQGSATVLIGGRPAVRQGDGTSHAGVVQQGCATVLIGG